MTTTFTKTTKTMAYARNAVGPNGTYMSVSYRSGESGSNPSGIDMVIGAKFEERCRCTFDKADIAELIEVLQDIHAAMEG